jgi:hypothetical protein
LQEVKAIGDLPCLRGSFARALGIEPGAIAADDLDSETFPEPRGGRRRGAIRKNVDDLSPLEINHDRSLVHAFLPCPIVDADDFDMSRRRAGARASLDLSQNRGVTDPHAEASHQPFGWPSANAMPEQANNSFVARTALRALECVRRRCAARNFDCGIAAASSELERRLASPAREDRGAFDDRSYAANSIAAHMLGKLHARRRSARPPIPPSPDAFCAGLSAPERTSADLARRASSVAKTTSLFLSSSARRRQDRFSVDAKDIGDFRKPVDERHGWFRVEAGACPLENRQAYLVGIVP